MMMILRQESGLQYAEMCITKQRLRYTNKMFLYLVFELTQEMKMTLQATRPLLRWNRLSQTLN